MHARIFHRNVLHWIFVSLLLFMSISANAQFKLIQDAKEINPNQDSCFRLTENIFWTRGAIWNQNPVDLTTDWEVNLRLNFGFLDWDGADGHMFVLHTDTYSIGDLGGGIGADGISPSIIVEFDTWKNRWDPLEDHAALLINGDVDHTTFNTLQGPVQLSAGSFNVEDFKYHRAKIVWNYYSGSSQRIRMYFDGCLRIDYTGNLIDLAFNNNSSEIYWGITASTGGAANVHEVCVVPNSEATDTGQVTICDGYSVFVGGAMQTTAGTYVDTLTNSNGCDSLVFTKVIVLDTAIVYDTVTICTGDSYLFNGTHISTPGMYSHTFTGPFSCDTIRVLQLYTSDTLFTTQNIGICDGETFQLPDESFVSTSGTYVSAIKADFGCDSIVTTNLAVFPLPVLYAFDDTICVNSRTSISVISQSENTVLWSNGATGLHIDIYTDEPLTLEIEAIDPNGCVSYDTMELAVKGYAITAYSENTTVNAGEPTRLYAIGGTSQTIFAWTPAEHLDDPSKRKPIATPLESTMFTVNSLAPNGCRAKDSVFIEVTQVRDFDIPTAFTPNNDGMNDFFRATTSSDLEVVSMRVFNRWGKEVFSFPGLSGTPQWDGTFQGVEQPMGGYVYMMQVRSIAGDQVTFREGVVTLLR